MKKILFAVILGSLILPMSSLAESNKDYFGISAEMSNIKDLTTKDTWSPYTLVFRGSSYVSDNVALEARFAAGTGPDKVRVSGTDVKGTLMYAASFFVKADLPLNTLVNFYGLAGMTTAKVELSALGTDFYNDNHGYSYGLGAEIPINKYMLINGEYVNYFKGEDFEYSGFNIGFTKLWQ